MYLPAKDTSMYMREKTFGKNNNKKPIAASDKELYENPRSRSAKLRAVERLCSNPK